MKISVYKGDCVEHEGEATMVVLPGVDGELSVCDFHKPFVYALGSGKLKIADAATMKIIQSFDTLSGIARFTKNTLKVFLG